MRPAPSTLRRKKVSHGPAAVRVAFSSPPPPPSASRHPAAAHIAWKRFIDTSVRRALSKCRATLRRIAPDHAHRRGGALPGDQRSATWVVPPHPEVGAPHLDRDLDQRVVP